MISATFLQPSRIAWTGIKKYRHGPYMQWDMAIRENIH